MLPVIASQKSLATTISQELPKYFTRDEVMLILDAVKDRPKNHLLINMLWQTGARISEMLLVKVKDVDFYAKTITIPTLKRRKNSKRIIPLQDGLRGELGAYIAQNRLQGDMCLFNVTRQRAFAIVKDAVHQASVNHIQGHPHMFRHSFAVNAVLSGVPIIVVKEWLGHKNILNTLVYIQILGKDTRHFYDGLQF